MNVFHGTTVACANKIMKDTFHITKFDAHHPGKMPNDLGAGVYTYCQDEEGLWNPYQNALRYAQCYRNNWGQEKCFSVISISISDDSSLKILDLDNKTNAKRFEEIRQALIKRINKVYKKYLVMELGTGKIKMVLPLKLHSTKKFYQSQIF